MQRVLCQKLFENLLGLSYVACRISAHASSALA